MKPELLVEIMRQNDAPFGNLFALSIGLSMLKDGSFGKEVLKHTKNAYHRIADIYEKIDFSVQIEETGKEILEKTKKTLDELTPMIDSIIEKAKKDIGTPQDIPDRVNEYLIELGECRSSYGKLPAYEMYRKAQNRNGMTRGEWFKQGKPRIEDYDFSVFGESYQKLTHSSSACF